MRPDHVETLLIYFGGHELNLCASPDGTLNIEERVHVKNTKKNIRKGQAEVIDKGWLPYHPKWRAPP